jgi:hypothetical protein
MIGWFGFRSLSWTSTETFLESRDVQTTMVKAAASAVYNWGAVAALPASAFRANKTYAILGSVLGHVDNVSLAARLLYGSTEFDGTLGTWSSTGGVNVGYSLQALARYNSGASPVDVALEICGRTPGIGPRPHLSTVQLIAVCLDDLGTENTDWFWTSNSSSVALNGTTYDGCTLSITGDGSTAWMFLGTVIQQTSLANDSAGWAGIRDDQDLDGSSNPKGLLQAIAEDVNNPDDTSAGSATNPPGRLALFFSVVRTLTAATHGMLMSVAEDVGGTSRTHLYSQLLALRLTGLGDLATSMRPPPGTEVSSGASFTSFANLAITPTKSKAFLVLATCSQTSNDDGTWGNPKSYMGLPAHWERLRVDADGGGAQSVPAYGDDSGATNYSNSGTLQFGQPALAVAVVNLTTGGSRTLDFQTKQASASYGASAIYMAAFRAPDPPPVIPGISMIRHGVV